MVTTSFFHAYDLRGVYPGEIGEEEARRVGKAFGTHVGDEVLVGRDARKHGETVKGAFVDGVVSTGTDVLDAGTVPTPVVYYGTVEVGVDASAVVTASHNPPEYTGFKFSKRGAVSMSREGGMAEIQKIYESGSFEEGDGELTRLEIVDDYLGFVEERIELESGLDVAVNYGNGVTAEVGGEMLRRLGCDVTEVNAEIDGEFPNHLPAPTEEEAQEQLREVIDGHDLGVLFDGDGDRAGFMLPDGRYVDEDEMISVFAENCLGRAGNEGKVVHDLRCSKLVPEVVEENGGEPVEERVGHTFISEAIHADPDVVFAGEVSGHYYFPVLDAPWDDGLLAAALACEIASRTDISAEVDDLPDYPVSPELRIDCPEDAKGKVVDEVAETYRDHEVSKLDGVKVFFDEGWALVRPSNTEEKMSVRCEADTEEALERILDNVEETVRGSIERA